MSSITIHNLDGDLDRRLTEEARRRKKSKNQLVKVLLAKSLGIPVEGRYSDDYQEFSGLWSREDLEEFNAHQADNSRVDPGDWRTAYQF